MSIQRGYLCTQRHLVPVKDRFQMAVLVVFYSHVHEDHPAVIIKAVWGEVAVMVNRRDHKDRGSWSWVPAGERTQKEHEEREEQCQSDQQNRRYDR